MVIYLRNLINFGKMQSDFNQNCFKVAVNIYSKKTKKKNKILNLYVNFMTNQQIFVEI